MSKSTQSFVEKCKTLFEKADASGDNKLSIQELRVLIKELCGDNATSDRMMADIFADLDDNDDKMLTWDEFSDVCFKKDPKSVQEHELRCVFKKCDKDGSGRLSADEIKAAFQELDIPGDPGRNLENADKDDDGMVNYEEFIASLGW
ncbi:neo-calmodulin-like [Babylonia areolata]|uniref:neo-calmodulin-like n=1 Tax=Babylonia areolata TaxID=304850 RepID=UPI003FD535B4